MADLRQASKIAFATEFTFYLKSHYFHWNVEGVMFLQFHDLFGKIYEEVFGSIDTFAEQLRALDVYAPTGLSKYSMINHIADEESAPRPLDMVRELYEDSQKITKLLKICFDMATAEGEDGYANFLAERMDAHRQHSWMLRSSLK